MLVAMGRSVCALVFAVSSVSVACAAEEAPPPSACESETRAMTFAPGLEVESEQAEFRATLVDSETGAPFVGKNVWSVAVDPLGELSNPEVTVEPYMPDHGHGSPAAPEITDPGDGTLRVANLDLFMSGYWEIRVKVSWTDADSVEQQDRAVFAFCLD
jgi:hypothetical protein